MDPSGNRPAVLIAANMLCIAAVFVLPSMEVVSTWLGCAIITLCLFHYWYRRREEEALPIREGVVLLVYANVFAALSWTWVVYGMVAMAPE
jgi:hypothetical protein